MLECSILIASLREEYLNNLVDSIREHTKGVDYEIVVCSPFKVKGVRWIKENENSFQYSAVKQAYEASTGKYVVLTADDTLARPRWLYEMMKFMKGHEGKLFQGGFRIYIEGFAEPPMPKYYEKIFPPFFCIERATVERLGGLLDCRYKAFFGDPDLTYRLYEAGGSMETCSQSWIQTVNAYDKQHEDMKNKYFKNDEKSFIERWGKIE